MMFRRNLRSVSLVAGAGLLAVVVACSGDGSGLDDAPGEVEAVVPTPAAVVGAAQPAPAENAINAEQTAEAPIAEQETARVAYSLGPGVHDFSLPSTDGETVSLSSFLGRKNVVVVFYRAFW